MIYLDSAATTFQKPAAVQRAVVRAMRTMSSPGRGGYAAAQQADELLFRCRSAAAELFSVPSSEQVVFTMNATHGLNIAIKSLVRPCGRVVVSGYEHNAVTRPLHALGAEVIVAAAPLFSPQETVEAFERALAHEPDAVICTHVSNVFGAILPIERIAQLCRGASVPLIIDASQSAGSLPIDFSALAPAFLAMPGHKGLYGPQGTGLLLCGSDALPLIEGGTGSESLRQSMPDFLPDRSWHRGARSGHRLRARATPGAHPAPQPRAHPSSRRGPRQNSKCTRISLAGGKLAGRGLIVHGGRPFARKCRRGDGKARYRAARGAALCAVRAQNGGDFARRNGAAERFRL